MPVLSLQPLRAIRTARLPRSTLSNFSRHSSSSSTSSHYAKQSTNGVVFGAAAVVGILGWTALAFKATSRSKPASASTADYSHLTALPPAPSSDAAEAVHETPADNEAPQGAYDPVTGEINWSCPCLGGMADGPCGEEFKVAFSCFVHSEDEPKGVDCVDKFRGMQECFRKHPDIYGSEAEDEESEEDLIERAEEFLKLDDEDLLRASEYALLD